MAASSDEWVWVGGSREACSERHRETDGEGEEGEGGRVTAAPSTRVVLLGSAQDAGVPQCGCYCAHCKAVLEGELPPKYTVSLGILHDGGAWLIDASPDIKWQLHLLRKAAPDCTLRGIFITHLHMGHYTGLLHLAKEVMSTKKLPVYATEPACRFLRTNEPWCHLVNVDQNIELCQIMPEQEIRLASQDGPGLKPCLVPHRAEYSDTLAYFIRGIAGRQMFYCPDIDSWDRWHKSLADVADTVDVQLVDSTFFSARELPGRDITKIPHPFIPNTAEHLPKPEQRRKTVLIHLNHSNPVYLAGSAERQWCLEQGFMIGHQEMSWDL
mmetsp:Transcript_10893/g.30846  ORF Transcript_10893/g.30846 Transcript_10893/m.30846 type:complete len:326 (-) Transcript_10893:258-1235(-)|eukprot:CAMPEP_0117681624 /NCGR_PEP_ID=MMETSP0804-20121206/19096_1 /TAXON_ID=1074897 /ORGANISM="Tetraselmis astigmatica, Strain CCMP880" /LENGTH=325 /DNA_ID=CAMNT_0005491423 /DNA_START=218 /DNA_END=1195 /DNA_ORIENTATION=+